MTYSFELGPIRPPSEAYSLLIRVTRNCPWNRCRFCHNYKGEKFQLRSVEEIKEEIKTAKAIQDKIKELSWKSGYGGRVKEAAAAVLSSSPGADVRNVALWLYAGGESAFLQDANSLIMRTNELAEVIRYQGNLAQHQADNQLCQVKDGSQEECGRAGRTTQSRAFPSAYRAGVRL